MATKRSNEFWIVLLVLLCGIVIGSLIGDMIPKNPFTSWLSYGKSFGISTASPFVLDLSVIKLSFGLMLNINIASILGMIIAYAIYRWIRR